jgi:predicted transcriptional regulator
MYSKEHKQQVVEKAITLVAQGHSISRSAALMGMPRAIVSKWMNEAGYGGQSTPKDIVHTLDEKREIVHAVAESVAQGVDRRQTIEQYGIDARRFNRWLSTEPSLRVDYFLICGKGVNTGYTRKTFEVIMESVRAGAAVQRDGARWKLKLVEGALMRYELTGSGQWISKGFATVSGTDILARDWTVVE